MRIAARSFWHFHGALHNNSPLLAFPEAQAPSMYRNFVVFIFLLSSGFADAQGPVADPEAFLQAQGIAGELRATWTERAQAARERYVHGFRVATPEGDVDHYFDAGTGEELDARALLAVGIYPKPTALPEISAAAERVDVGEGPRASAKRVFAGALPEFVLPPLDRESLLAEDAARDDFARGRLRLGVVEDLPEPITHATTGTKVQGSARGVALRAPGAFGLRLHVTFENVAAVAGFRVYDPARPGEVHTPPRGATAWWSPTCWGEVLHIEADAPGYEIGRVAQVYRQPGDESAKAAGACELDATCHERWQEQALGVGGIGTIDLDAFIFCTASLLVDADPDTNVPYLLTGNHCVANNGQAEPLEVYWLYQTARCNGPIPDLGEVPRTVGGADFLTGSGNFFGTDLSLLRLNQQPPPGLTWLGWETASPTLGAEVVCIHHPDGDFKRISFGEIADTGRGRLRPASRYHEVQWYAGVTEPGSSGSPLFLSSTQRIIGQLYGGGSSCSAPLDSDYYGRFDVSYIAAQRFLGRIQNPFDVTGDRVVNAADLQRVVNASLTRPSSPLEDFDKDGRVNASDIQAAVLAVLSFSR